MSFVRVIMSMFHEHVGFSPPNSEITEMFGDQEKEVVDLPTGDAPAFSEPYNILNSMVLVCSITVKYGVEMDLTALPQFQIILVPSFSPVRVWQPGHQVRDTHQIQGIELSREKFGNLEGSAHEAGGGVLTF